MSIVAASCRLRMYWILVVITRSSLQARGGPQRFLVQAGIRSKGLQQERFFTPDEILAGEEPENPVVIYDFDHYYMGSCLAELLRQRGCEVTIVTTANAVSAWTFMSNELVRIRERMLDLNIATVFEQYATGLSNGSVKLTSIYRDSDVSALDCASLVVVGVKTPNDSLFQELDSDADRLANAGLNTLRSIGDCRAPGTIAHAVYSGHECARTIDAGDSIEPFALEQPLLLSKS